MLQPLRKVRADNPSADRELVAALNATRIGRGHKPAAARVLSAGSGTIYPMAELRELSRSIWVNLGGALLIPVAILVLAHPERFNVVAAVALSGSVLGLLVVGVAIGQAALRTYPAGVWAVLSFLGVNFVVTFAALYWAFGVSSNFTKHLSVVDAFYFTLGTLSTAGTGSLALISQVARVLQAIQMVMDMIFLLFTLAAVLGRAVTVVGQPGPRWRDRSRPTPNLTSPQEPESTLD